MRSPRRPARSARSGLARPGLEDVEAALGRRLKQRLDISVNFIARQFGPALEKIRADANKNRTAFEELNKAVSAREGLDAQLDLAIASRKVADAAQAQVVGVDEVTAATENQITAMQKVLGLTKEKVRRDVEAKAKPFEDVGLSAAGIRAAGVDRGKALDVGAGLEIEALQRQMRDKLRETRKLEAEDLVARVNAMQTIEGARREHALRMLDIEQGLTGDVDAAQRRRAQLEDEGSAAEIRALHRSLRARLDVLDTRAEGASVEQLRLITSERVRILEEGAKAEEAIAQTAAENRARRAAEEKQARQKHLDDMRGVGESTLSAAAAILQGQGINQFDLGDLQGALKAKRAEGEATRSDLLTGGAVSGDAIRNMIEDASRQRAEAAVGGGSLESLTRAGVGGGSVSQAWRSAADALHVAFPWNTPGGEQQSTGLEEAYKTSFDAVVGQARTFGDQLAAEIDAGNKKVANSVMRYFVNGLPHEFNPATGVARQIELEDRRF